MACGIQLHASVIVASACVLAGATPAAASTYDYLSKGKPVPSMSRGSKTVMCTHGRRLVGGGVITSHVDPANPPTIIALQPLDRTKRDPDHVTDDGFKAVIDNPGTASVHMATWAICAAKKVGKHLLYRSVRSTMAGLNDAIVACPDGSRIVSGGGVIPAPFGGGAVHSSAPLDGPDGDMAPDDLWDFFVDVPPQGKITGYAICANGKYAKGLHYVTAEGSIGPMFGFLQADCKPHERVLGGGALGTDLPIQVYLADDGPKDSGGAGGAPDNAWIAHAAVPNSSTPYGVDAICHA